MQKITKTEFKEILASHKKWLKNNENGNKADLSGADLRETDLSGADLRKADLSEADMRRADLYRADLSEANLNGADLDFSCLPLWCGGLDIKVDKRIAVQIAYHFCRLDCTAPEFIQARNAILDFANQFHRVGECGKLEKIITD